jgi:hypothetical protein
MEEKLRPNKDIGWNINKGGLKPPLNFFRGSKHPMWGKKRPDVRKRMFENNPMKLPEYREKQRQRAIEFNNRSEVKEKARQRMIENNPMKNSKIVAKIVKYHVKDWPFISPKGKLILIHNLAKFCREHNLGQGNMVHVAQGKLKQCKGWTCLKK